MAVGECNADALNRDEFSHDYVVNLPTLVWAALNGDETNLTVVPSLNC